MRPTTQPLDLVPLTLVVSQLKPGRFVRAVEGFVGWEVAAVYEWASLPSKLSCRPVAC
jgi:hypothetical protein